MRRVVFTRRAERQTTAAAHWWAQHRDKAPDAFDEDFVEGVKRIAANAGLGVPVAQRKGVRKLLLDRVRYYIYYRVVSDDVLEIISIWHASRRSPRL